MEQTNCKRRVAIDALNKNNNDIINSILYIVRMKITHFISSLLLLD